ncbi:MAG: hypothetical protein E6522_09555, partial [Streptococcus vestibularis]|nr:hypothetical protein [Streptococcus vestibularis]
MGRRAGPHPEVAKALWLRINRKPGTRTHFPKIGHSCATGSSTVAAGMAAVAKQRFLLPQDNLHQNVSFSRSQAAPSAALDCT